MNYYVTTNAREARNLMGIGWGMAWRDGTVWCLLPPERGNSERRKCGACQVEERETCDHDIFAV